MIKVSNAASRLFDKLKPYVHPRHCLICARPDVEVGSIRPMTKKEIARSVNLSVGHVRTLLNELCDAGYIAYFHVGTSVKIAVNPNIYRVGTCEPSPTLVDLFSQHERMARYE